MLVFCLAYKDTSKLPVPAWDSKWEWDGGGKNVKGIFCHRVGKLGATISHLLPHMMRFKCFNGGVVLHLKLCEIYVAF